MIVSDVVVKNMPSSGILVTVVKTDAVVDISAVVVIICVLDVVVMKNVMILQQYVKAAKSIIISVTDIAMTATNWVLGGLLSSLSTAVVLFIGYFDFFQI
ncbi:16548_t:CDS:2 [Acaulospora colombiana]|uniref:16548_t:CDS:1 n=1 Tax=Acaulospora colombiana TaxID=27376 RepID=A0ACA9MFB5_9GLOM|nr:16548_t:CDS:2 [Acaulospora colombiana]